MIPARKNNFNRNRPGFKQPRTLGKPQAGAEQPDSGRPRRRREPNVEQMEDEQDEGATGAQIESILREQLEKAAPVPIQHHPRQYDFSALKETWPSLPTSTSGRVSSAFEKMLWLGDRYPNGYVPPYELAKRLYSGERVFFLSEEEKTEALDEARKLAQQRADSVSKEKGDLVDPEEIVFEEIGEEDQVRLMGSLVKGDYTKNDGSLPKQSPVLGDIMKKLANNPTYQTAGKREQFSAKLDSLLGPRRQL